MPANYDDILKNVEERDYIDSHREVSPLRKADDAIELDNSNLTIDEQKQWLMSLFNEKTKRLISLLHLIIYKATNDYISLGDKLSSKG